MRPRRQPAGPMHSWDPWDGILLVDKPSGPTSHDIVDLVRQQFRIDKVGHGGTLDPMATGLLVILLGRGTKLSNRIMGTDKVYEGTMRLGVATDTGDAEGRVVSEAPFDEIQQGQVEEQMRKLTGDIMQMPPMVSAVKKDGVPLYKLARKGESVEREPRLIHIYSFTLTSFDLPFARFTLSCTKGTYVRTLCSDIGDALGCGAHLSQLRRTRSGSLRVEDAVPFEELVDMGKPQMIERIIPIHQLVMEELDK